MKIFLTGANGYIGKRVLPALIDLGHSVVAGVRDRARMQVPDELSHAVEVIETDFLKPETLNSIPKDIDVAYYLIHSMGSSSEDFESLEAQAAENFVRAIENTTASQIIYLGGIANADELSKHLRSRMAVENILKKCTVPLTAFRAGIIVGSGSASFEIIRDITEKLPVMITPRWVKTRSKPIAIRNVIEFLVKSVGHQKMIDQSIDIGGPDILTYKEMILQFAEVRNLKRFIFTVPFLTPRLSSYWLYFVTSTNYKLAVNLVNSMKVEVVPIENNAAELLGIELVSYKDSVKLAFQVINSDMVVSSWKDAYAVSDLESRIIDKVEVPVHGCYKDYRELDYEGDISKLVHRIWSIGGDTGWYYGDFLWHIRGFLDKLVGGVGLRRGRTKREDIEAGDSLDFWRVMLADRESKRLLLFAEMKLPGEAWLEFRVDDTKDGKYRFIQEATFRPKGIWGRMYWNMLLPFHHFVFNGMIRNIKKSALKDIK